MPPACDLMECSWARSGISAHYSLSPHYSSSPHPESESQAEADSRSPRGQTDLLAHVLITGKEKSHSLEWLELLGILNEVLVKMALNVSGHRKTPVLHSTVGCLTLQVSTTHERWWLGYCQINPHSFAQVSLVLWQWSRWTGSAPDIIPVWQRRSMQSMLFMVHLACAVALLQKFQVAHSVEHVHTHVYWHSWLNQHWKGQVHSIIPVRVFSLEFEV